MFSFCFYQCRAKQMQKPNYGLYIRKNLHIMGESHIMGLKNKKRQDGTMDKILNERERRKKKKSPNEWMYPVWLIMYI